MLLPELIEYIFALCSSKDRSILCQVSKEWHTLAIMISIQMSSLGTLYYGLIPFNVDCLYKSGDYHLIVRLKIKYTYLYSVCLSGNIDVVNLMISLGVNKWNQGLYGACFGGHIKIAQLMVANGAVGYNEGLFWACKGGHLELAKLMISLGANYWNYGLRAACEGGRLELVQLMISHDANDWNWGLAGACVGGHLQLIQLAISHGAIKCDNCGKLATEH